MWGVEKVETKAVGMTRLREQEEEVVWFNNVLPFIGKPSLLAQEVSRKTIAYAELLQKLPLNFKIAWAIFEVCPCNWVSATQLHGLLRGSMGSIQAGRGT